MSSEAAARLGLLWESDVVEQGGRRYVVRVVQKGTRVKSPGASLLGSAPAEIGAAVIVLLVPLRALALLLFGQRYKVGVVRLGTDGTEAVVHTERVHGEAAARTRGRVVVSGLTRRVDL